MAEDVTLRAETFENVHTDDRDAHRSIDQEVERGQFCTCDGERVITSHSSYTNCVVTYASLAMRWSVMDGSMRHQLQRTHKRNDLSVSIIAKVEKKRKLS